MKNARPLLSVVLGALAALALAEAALRVIDVVGCPVFAPNSSCGYLAELGTRSVRATSELVSASTAEPNSYRHSLDCVNMTLRAFVRSSKSIYHCRVSLSCYGSVASA